MYGFIIIFYTINLCFRNDLKREYYYKNPQYFSRILSFKISEKRPTQKHAKHLRWSVLQITLSQVFDRVLDALLANIGIRLN